MCWTSLLGVACLGARHPPPRSADDNSGSLHARPGDRPVDPVVPEGWCSGPGVLSSFKRWLNDGVV